MKCFLRLLGLAVPKSKFDLTAARQEEEIPGGSYRHHDAEPEGFRTSVSSTSSHSGSDPAFKNLTQENTEKCVENCIVEKVKELEKDKNQIISKNSSDDRKQTIKTTFKPKLVKQVSAEKPVALVSENCDFLIAIAELKKRLQPSMADLRRDLESGELLERFSVRNFNYLSIFYLI